MIKIFEGVMRQFAVLVMLMISTSAWSLDQSATDPLKKLDCLITTDFYIVHLTSYQEPNPDAKKRHKFQAFCQTLPDIGKSYLAVDFIDRDLRQMAIKMHVVEKKDNPDGDEMLDGKILAETVVSNYKNGVAQIQVSFPEKGHYELVVTVGDDMFADKIKIPLRVAIGEPFSWGFLMPVIIFVLITGVAYLIYRFFLERYRKELNKGGS